MNITLCRALEKPYYDLAYTYIPSVSYKVAILVLPLFITVTYIMAEIVHSVYGRNDAEEVDDDFLPEDHILLGEGLDLINPFVEDENRRTAIEIISDFNILIRQLFSEVIGFTPVFGEIFVIASAALFSISHFMAKANLEGFLKSSKRICDYLNTPAYSLAELKEEVVYYNNYQLIPKLETQLKIYKIIDSSQLLFATIALISACYLKLTSKNGAFKETFTFIMPILFISTIGMVYISLINVYTDFRFGRPSFN